jgi:hypothetical protein
MSDSIQRRDFIKTASIIGASIAIVNPVSAKEFLPGNDDHKIKNDYFTVSFDKKKGTINIYRSNGTTLIIGATTCINSSTGKQFISSVNYKYTTKSNLFSDHLGAGRRLIIFSHDINRKLDFEIQLSLYDHLEAITIEVICKNVSDSDLVINSMEPLRVIKNEGGILNVPDVSKCISNGEMYFDTGSIHEFGTNDNAVSSGDLKGVKLANGSISSQSETIHSWWNAGLFNGYDKEGLVLGYLENNICLGNLLISKTSSNEISFVAESVYAPQVILKPGKNNQFKSSHDQHSWRSLYSFGKLCSCSWKNK